MFQGKEYIYEVYKTKSFSKAAANLYISQPSLSATIKKIESRLGVSIFDRSTNPLQLTECGLQYIQYIERIQDMESEFENYLNNLHELRTGHLTIGGSNLFSSYILPPLLLQFMEKYPSIEVKMIEASTKSLESQLFSGALDMIIDNYPFSEAVYDRVFFDREQLLLAVPECFPIEKQIKKQQLMAEDILKHRHLASTVPVVSLKDFQSHPFILLRSGNDTRERAEQLFKNAGINPNITLQLDQQVTAYHVSCSGMGISFISDTLIRQVSPDPRISFYKLEDAAANRNINFYYKHSRYVTRAMEEFLKITCPHSL